MYIVFPVSILPLVAGVGEMRFYIPFGTFGDLVLTVTANPNSSHSYVSALALRQTSPSSSATDVSSVRMATHIVFLAWPSSAMQLARFTEKWRPIVLPHTAAVQFRFFRRKWTVFFAILLRLRMRPMFNS